MNANEICWLALLTINASVMSLNVGMWAGSGTSMKPMKPAWTALSAVMVVVCFVRLAAH